VIDMMTEIMVNMIIIEVTVHTETVSTQICTLKSLRRKLIMHKSLTLQLNKDVCKIFSEAAKAENRSVENLTETAAC